VEVKFGSITVTEWDEPIPVPELEWVEIGGLKWAKYNVDMPNSFAATPYAAGMYYQWNRNVSWYYSEGNVLHNSEGGGTWNTIETASSEWETGNNPCPKGYRVPTKENFQALINKGFVAGYYAAQGEGSGVFGRWFGTDDLTKAQSNPGLYIFLPAAGKIYNTNGLRNGTNLEAYYYCNTLYNPTNADVLTFVYESPTWVSFYDRKDAMSVRCVAE